MCGRATGFIIGGRCWGMWSTWSKTTWRRPLIRRDELPVVPEAESQTVPCGSRQDRGRVGQEILCERCGWVRQSSYASCGNDALLCFGGFFHDDDCFEDAFLPDCSAVRCRCMGVR